MASRDLFADLDLHVAKQEEIELMLLKGHLILEQCLNELLRFHIPDASDLERLNLTFARKLDLLQALGHKFSGPPGVGIAQIREVNRIRNKLAHTLDFADYHPELKKWACTVLGYTPVTLNRTRTFLNMVKKAFYLLTGYLWGTAVTRLELQEAGMIGQLRPLQRRSC